MQNILDDLWGSTIVLIVGLGFTEILKKYGYAADLSCM